jgi:predicted 2-oxoglutarate/Fe(II)-dependent dioxygenase YbiX
MATLINSLYIDDLTPTETVAGCIDIFENAWPFPETVIKAIEEECQSSESDMVWQKAKEMKADKVLYVGSNRTNFNLSISSYATEGSSAAQAINNQMYLLLLSAALPYAKKHNIPELHFEGYEMIKYETGQEFKAHSDGITASGRSVSAIVYLNDEYTGGELEFVNFGVKIKPKPGMLILFPSNYPYAHIAHPVKTGIKYAIVTWMHDRPFDA